MNCPYCSGQMKKGEIHFSTLSPLKILQFGKWFPKDDDKNKHKTMNMKKAVKIEDFALDFLQVLLTRVIIAVNVKKL